MFLRPVVGYDGIFSVTESGDVYSHRTFKFLAQGELHNGYKCISSRIGGRKGKCICLRVHRMVAEAYVMNEDGKPFVNHIDGNKHNNHFKNLEWCTSQENMSHAFRTGLDSSAHLDKYNRSRMVLDSEQIEYVKMNYSPHDRFFGARALSRKFGCSHSVITRAYYS